MHHGDLDPTVYDCMEASMVATFKMYLVGNCPGWGFCLLEA